MSGQDTDGEASVDPSTVALPTQRVFGFDFIDDDSVDATAEAILSPQPDDGRLPLVSTPNVDQLVRMNEAATADLGVTLQRARYVLPDGQPIIWMSKALGRPLEARLPGSTLVPPLWRRAAADDLGVVVVASSDDLAERLRADHPGATCLVAPFYDADDADAGAALVDRLYDAVVEARPRLVFLTLGFPKQERLALGLLNRLAELDGAPEPVILLIGGSFNMYFDITPRAPEWMQRAGLEWFYRFILEPRRLFRRYFITDAKFVPLAVTELRRHRRQRV